MVSRYVIPPEELPEYSYYGARNPPPAPMPATYRPHVAGRMLEPAPEQPAFPDEVPEDALRRRLFEEHATRAPGFVGFARPTEFARQYPGNVQVIPGAERLYNPDGGYTRRPDEPSSVATIRRRPARL